MPDHLVNPFKPTAGASPPLLIGREPVLDAFAESFDDGPGAPGRLSFVTGARGVGKTVVLNEVEDLALERGWLSINETATSGLIARLDEHVAHLADGLDRRPRRRVTAVTMPAQLGAVTTELTPDLSVDVRRRLTNLLGELRRRDSGLLLTLDEVHVAARGELRELAAIAQHLVREDHDFALVMAGLPSAVSSLLSDDVLTFLRRADKHVLADVEIEDVRDALVRTIEEGGRRLEPRAAELAARTTGGYPFLVQLVGYHVWRATEATEIGLDAVDAGVASARRRLGSLVHETALNDLSDVDRTFLMAMSADDGPTKMADVLVRMGGVAPQYANMYRVRLIEAGMIEPAGHGRVTFALPYLRDFLREHGATLGLASPRSKKQ